MQITDKTRQAGTRYHLHLHRRCSNENEQSIGIMTMTGRYSRHHRIAKPGSKSKSTSKLSPCTNTSTIRIEDKGEHIDADKTNGSSRVASRLRTEGEAGYRGRPSPLPLLQSSSPSPSPSSAETPKINVFKRKRATDDAPSPENENQNQNQLWPSPGSVSEQGNKRQRVSFSSDRRHYPARGTPPISPAATDSNPPRDTSQGAQHPLLKHTHAHDRRVTRWLESLPDPDRFISAEMTERVVDAQGFAVPPIPASASASSLSTPISHAPSSEISVSSSTARSLIEDPKYRQRNLAENGIHLRPSRMPLPEHIARLVERIKQGRASPTPTFDTVDNDERLADIANGAGEPDVEEYWKSVLFTAPSSGDVILRSIKRPMSKHAVPSTPGSRLRVSNPVPDLLYGYKEGVALTSEAQCSYIRSTTNSTDDPAANIDSLLYPFLLVEFKGDGPGSTNGSLYLATNQCLGGSASCTLIMDRLRTKAEPHSPPLSPESPPRLLLHPETSATFSIAMDNLVARLYVTWRDAEKPSLGFEMQEIGIFLLPRPEGFVDFRAQVRNIIDWGRGQRLQEIQSALDSLSSVEPPHRPSVLPKAGYRSIGSAGSSSSGGAKRRRSSSSVSSGGTQRGNTIAASKKPG